MVGRRAAIAEKWHKFRHDTRIDDSAELEEPAPFGVPLPGEYIVVERHWQSLLDRLQTPEIPPKLEEACKSYPSKKYCAMVYKYLEAVTWMERVSHACILLVLCSTGDGDSDNVLPKDLIDNGPDLLGESEWIAIPARLWTLDGSPTAREEGKSARLSPDELEDIYRRSVSSSASPCEHGTILCKPDTEPIPNEVIYASKDMGDSDDYESDTDVPQTRKARRVKRETQEKKKKQKLSRNWILWPHLSFDLNAHQTVSSGKGFLAEQSAILRIFDDHRINVPCITGIIATAGIHFAGPPYPHNMVKSIEKTRYHRHYMIDHHEAHLIVISSDRLESRAYTVLLVPDCNINYPEESWKWMIRSLPSVARRPYFLRTKKIKDLFEFFDSRDWTDGWALRPLTETKRDFHAV